jgi:hypothetical protein
MSIFITVSAKTKKELAWRKQQVIDMLKAIDIFVSDAKFKQQEALMSVMPFLQMDKSLEKKSKRNVLTTGAASSYMFTSFELSDDNGVLLGVNQHNNSLCIVDLFNSKKNKNANMNLIGTSGAGKTFTMQLLALRMRMRGIQSFILAPIKGHEFKRACKAIGGSYIKIAPGSPHCINIMEIRPTTTPELELIDSGNYHESDSILARKIQQLTIFFALLIPDMTNEEEQLLDEALIKTYKDHNPDVDIVICTSPEVLENNSLGIPVGVLSDHIYPMQLEIAKEVGAALIDFHAFFKSKPEKDRAQYYRDDGVHITYEAALELAAMIKKNV